MNTVVVLEGNIVDRKRELDKIKLSLGDYEQFVFDKEDSYDYVSQFVSEISCFEKLRLFIIKELPRIEAPNAAQERSKVLNRFKKLFPFIPAGNLVVFNDIGISAESFFKEVRKYGKVHKFPQKIKKDEAKRKINKFLNNKNIQFDDDTTTLIVDSLNPDGADIDLDKLHLLMRKVYNYIAGKTKITKEDVYNVCDTSKAFIIWNLYNLLDNKEMCSSLSVVTDFLANCKNFKFESEFLLKGMIWRYGLLLMAKNGINDKKSQEIISQEISNINKLETTGKKRTMQMNRKFKDNKEVPEYSSKMINSVFGMGYNKSPLPFYSCEQLLLIYYSLVKTLIKIRSGCTEAEVGIAFHLNILVICGQIMKKNTIDGILEYKKMIYKGC